MIQLIDADQIGKDNQDLFEGMLIEMRHSRNILDQIAKYVEIQGMKFEFSYHKLLDLINNEINDIKYNKCDFILNINEKFEDVEVYIEKNVFVNVFHEILNNAYNHTRNSRIEININF